MQLDLVHSRDDICVLEQDVQRLDAEIGYADGLDETYSDLCSECVGWTDRGALRTTGYELLHLLPCLNKCWAFVRLKCLS